MNGTTVLCKTVSKITLNVADTLVKFAMPPPIMRILPAERMIKEIQYVSLQYLHGNYIYILYIKWRIIKQIPAGSRKCRPCLEGKLLILIGRDKNI